jgi:hypothetical protein
MDIKQAWDQFKQKTDGYIDHLYSETDYVKRAAAHSDMFNLFHRFDQQLIEVIEKTDNRSDQMEIDVYQARTERAIITALRPYALALYLMLMANSSQPSMDSPD